MSWVKLGAALVGILIACVLPLAVFVEAVLWLTPSAGPRYAWVGDTWSLAAALAIMAGCVAWFLVFGTWAIGRLTSTSGTPGE